MRKHLLLIGLIIGLSWYNLGVFMQNTPDQALFNILYAGSPDEYGNQILNVSVSQDVGGIYKLRGIVTESNYSKGSDIYGFINETTRFNVIVALNYSWAESSSLAVSHTNVYITILGEYSDQIMDYVSIDLVSQGQGWILEYQFIWSDDGKPDPGSQTISFEYEATGSSKNYNLTYYDAEFSYDYSTYFVDGSNTTDYTDYAYRCSVTSSGGIMKITQNDATAGFGAEDNGISLPVGSNNAFLEWKITEVSGCTWMINVYDVGGYLEGYSGGSNIGVFRLNIRYILGGNDLAKLRFHSPDATIGDYIKIDYIGVYGHDEWADWGSNSKNALAYTNPSTGINISSGADTDYRMQHLEIIENENGVIKAQIRGAGTFQLYIYDGSSFQSGDSISCTSKTEWETYSFDVSSYPGLIQLYLVVKSSNSWVQVFNVYVEQYGYYNQSLTEGGNTDGDFEGAGEPLAWGYDGFYYSKPEEGSGGGFWNQTGFRPLDNLGEFTLVMWVWVYAFGHAEDEGAYLEESETEYYLFSQYVDENNQVSLVYNESKYFIGRLGNSTDMITVDNGVHNTNMDIGPEYTAYCLVLQGSKGGTLKLSVNGSMTASNDVWMGVISADADMYILSRDGNYIYSPFVAVFETSIYYYNFSNAQLNNVYGYGPDKVMTTPFHSYSFNEVSQLGYSSGSSVLHDSEYVTAIRETWTIDYNGGTLSGYLFPWPFVYMEIYIWLGGWVLMGAGPSLAIWKGRENKKDLFLYVLIAGVTFFIGASLVFSGV